MQRNGDVSVPNLFVARCSNYRQDGFIFMNAGYQTVALINTTTSCRTRREGSEASVERAELAGQRE